MDGKGGIPLTHTTLRDTLNPKHTALVIVDLQNDFCSPSGAAERAGRDISYTRPVIANVNRLLSSARRKGVLVVFAAFSTLKSGISNRGSWIAQRQRSPFSSATMCVDDSWGAEIVEDLAVNDSDIVVRKLRYSAFVGTPLDLLLRTNSIRTIVVTGVSTNCCVESTVRHGFDIGYHVVVPYDCVSSWDKDLHEATLNNVRYRFGLVVNSEDIVDLWSGRV